MDRERISALVRELDELVPVEPASVRTKQYGGDGDESVLVATEPGYLRLGLELMKAASAPYVGSSDACVVAADVGPLLTADSEIRFTTFQRPARLDAASSNGSRWGDVLGRVLGFAFVSMTLLGIVTAIRWLFGILG